MVLLQAVREAEALLARITAYCVEVVLVLAASMVAFFRFDALLVHYQCLATLQYVLIDNGIR